MKNSTFAISLICVTISPVLADAEPVCAFQAKYAWMDSNQINIKVKDGNSILDQKSFTFSSQRDAEQTCLSSVKALEGYENDGVCKVVWSGVELQLNESFAAFRYKIPDCMGRVKSHEPKADAEDPSVQRQMAVMRRRLASVLGQAAVREMSDTSVMSAMQNLSANKFDCKAAAHFQVDSSDDQDHESNSSAR